MMKKSLIFLLSLFLLAQVSFAKYYVSVPEHRDKKDYISQGKDFAVATQGIHTSYAAKRIMQLGGNVFDAMVAASFVISVERPHSSGLGGGGFLTYYNKHTKKTEIFDFREQAPGRSYQKMYLDSKGKPIADLSRKGSLSVAVPGLVKGLCLIHKKFGKLPLKTVMTPAIKLAKEGLVVYPALAQAMKIKEDDLAKFPASAKIFLKNGKAYKVGEILYQKDLAKSLELISKGEDGAFYRGEIAKKIINSLKHHNGLLELSDLNNYEVKQRSPVLGEYHGNKIISMPPPSSGGIHILEILNILENFPLEQWGASDIRSLHVTALAMQMAFADRATYLGDTDYVQVPVKKLISKKYAKRLAKLINLDRAIPSKQLNTRLRPLLESDHTTHLSLADSKGNFLSTTQTINGYFGSSLVAEGTGIVLNNEMDDFSAAIGNQNLYGAVGGKNNLITPGKRPLSSMSPTILIGENGDTYAIGTPSGTRILTCVVQTILNLSTYKMTPWQALSYNRIHHQWYPERLRIGPPFFDSKVLAGLRALGHDIEKKSLGCKIQLVMQTKEGRLIAVSDPREEGQSLAY